MVGVTKSICLLAASILLLLTPGQATAIAGASEGRSLRAEVPVADADAKEAAFEKGFAACKKPLADDKNLDKLNGSKAQTVVGCVLLPTIHRVRDYRQTSDDELRASQCCGIQSVESHPEDSKRTTMSSLRRLALPVGCFAGGVASGMALLNQQQTPALVSSAALKQQQTAASANPFDAPVDLFDAVGNTPLIELKSLSKLTGSKIYAKAEYMNPCGSVKDRAAKFLILDAEEKGLLKKGDTIVEATGGNTGVSLALLAAARGYKAIFTMPEKTAREKIELMKVMGAQVFVQPMASMFDKENHFYHVAQRIAKATEGAVYPNQFENTANMKAHYMTTGPEIWRQTSGKIDGFVTSSGTAGTISGVSKFLRETKPECAVWIVDPEEVAGISKFVNDDKTTSTWKDGFEVVPTNQGSTIAEGVGLPRVTPNFREAKVDKGITGTNQEIVDMAYFLLRNDGIFVGPSAALNVVGAVKMARELGPGSTVVTILCDGGDRYQSKLYNREWLAQENLLPSTENNSNKDGDMSLDFVKPIKLP